MTNEETAKAIVDKFMQHPVLSYQDLYNIVLFILNEEQKK